MVAQRAGSRRGCTIVQPSPPIDGVKVFSASVHAQREQLGELVTAWLMAHRELTIVDVTVVQSSDAAFHCISIVVWYREHKAA